jgi:nicotinamidase-related amidase
MPGFRLEDLVEPGRVALVVQEVQNGVVGDESSLPALAEAAGRIGLIGHVAELASAARAAGVPVVHCTAENLAHNFGINRNARLFAGALKAGAANQPGSRSVQVVDEVGVGPADIVLPRFYGLSPLTCTPLDALLRNAGISTVVVTGVSMNVAIPNLVFDAVNRSYQVVLVQDAVAGVPDNYGDQLIQNSLGLLATVVSTKELEAVWRSAAPA